MFIVKPMSSPEQLSVNRQFCRTDGSHEGTSVERMQRSSPSAKFGGRSRAGRPWPRAANSVARRKHGVNHRQLRQWRSKCGAVVGCVRTAEVEQCEIVRPGQCAAHHRE